MCDMMLIRRLQESRAKGTNQKRSRFFPSGSHHFIRSRCLSDTVVSSNLKLRKSSRSGIPVRRALSKMASKGGKNNLNWESFEELTKVAFVADPHADTRFFLKTRVTPASKAAVGQKKPSTNNIKIVARVSTRPKKKNDHAQSGDGPQQQPISQSIKYQTLAISNLTRLTRLLRFVMQEVLGPMRPSAASKTPPSTGTDAPPPSAPASASKADKSKKKKKKGGKK